MEERTLLEKPELISRDEIWELLEKKRFEELDRRTKLL
jgi:hypothetical protein